jgi:hypothetical protein
MTPPKPKVTSLNRKGDPLFTEGRNDPDNAAFKYNTDMENVY